MFPRSSEAPTESFVGLFIHFSRARRKIAFIGKAAQAAERSVTILGGCQATAANIPGVRLRIVPGMGHYLPEALVPLLVDEIADHCSGAETMTPGATRRVAGGPP